MSIYPKIAIKGKDRIIKLHMKVTNNTSKRIYGVIEFKIKRPDRRVEILKKGVFIGPNSSTDRYFKYTIKNKPIGKYIVEGRFYYDGRYVKSETWRNDFFEIREVKK